MRSIASLKISLAALSLLASQAAFCADPFAADIGKRNMAAYKESRNGFLDAVAVIYHAIGCEVLPDEVSAIPLLNVMARPLEEDQLRYRLMDQDVRSMMYDAAQRGTERSAKPGGCKYWYEHPEAVQYVRRQAAIAAAR